MHPDDYSPYRSREDLFETIRQQRIDLDNKDEEIRKLKDKLSSGRLQCLDDKPSNFDINDLDSWSRGLPV